MLLASIGIAVLVSIQTNLRVLLFLACIVTAGGIAARTHWKLVLSLAGKFEIFVLFWIVMEPFMYGHTIIAVLPSPFGALPLFLEGLVLGIMLSLRMFLILLVFMGTMSHMTLSEFIGAIRGLRVPVSMLGSLLIMLKYIPQFVHERRSMHESQLLRGLESGKRAGRIRSLGYLIGTTIDRAFDRSLFVYDSMTLRGFGKRSHVSGTGFRRFDIIIPVLVFLLAVNIYAVLPVLFEVLCT